MNVLVKVMSVFLLTGVLGNASLPLTSFEEGVEAFEQGKHKEAYKKLLPLANKHDLVAQEYIRWLITKDQVTLNDEDEKEITFSASAPPFPEAKEWLKASLLNIEIKQGGKVKKELDKLKDLKCSYADYVLGNYHYQQYLSTKDSKKKLKQSGDSLDLSKFYYEKSEEKGGYRAAWTRYALKKIFNYSGPDLDDLTKHCLFLTELTDVMDEGERYEKIFNDIKSAKTLNTDTLFSGSMHGNPHLSQIMLTYVKDNLNFLPCLEAHGHSGNPHVLGSLGFIYYTQLNDPSKAYDWFIVGGRKGIVDCYDFLYAFSYETKNYEAYRVACEALLKLGRDVSAELGYLYVQGLVGTSQEENDKQAAFYFKKSIEGGENPDYKNLLTMMREKRGGLTGDEEEQLSLLQDWVKRGENPEEALYLLGQYYHNTNPEMAEEYYTKASEKGHGQSFANLFEFEVNKAKGLDEKKEVFKKIRLFAENEYSPEMQFLYGTLLYFGVTDIAESNYELALQYITEAAKTVWSAKAFKKRIEACKKLQDLSKKTGIDVFLQKDNSIVLHGVNTFRFEEREQTEEQKLLQKEIEKLKLKNQKIEQEFKEKMLEFSNKKYENLILLEEGKKMVEEKKEENLTNNDENETTLKEEGQKEENWQKYMNFTQYDKKDLKEKDKNKDLEEKEEKLIENKKEKKIGEELEEFMNMKQVKPMPLNQILTLMSRFTQTYGGEIKLTSNGYLFKKDDKVTSFHQSHGRNKDLDKGAIKGVVNTMNNIKNEEDKN
jgi:hypothetical protein